ncbi:imidazoleglycerol-phosphate dehydratase HisB [Candidatus Omnitrophota bacterium]
MRKAKVKRVTKETKVEIELTVDGKGKYTIATGIGFLDHMLSLFSKHGVFDLKLKASGDLAVDLHHTNEDVGITLGEAFAKALKSKAGLSRFGVSYSVLDEAQVRAVVDVSGRPYFDLSGAKAKSSGNTGRDGYSLSYFKQFMRAFVNAAGLTVHIDIVKGQDLHHILECCFKALGIALDQATALDRRKKGLPTTKGKL